MLAACREAAAIEWVMVAPGVAGVALPEYLREEQLVRLNLVAGRDTPEVMLDEWGIRCELTFQGVRKEVAFPWTVGGLRDAAPPPERKKPRFGAHPGREEGLTAPLIPTATQEWVLWRSDGVDGDRAEDAHSGRLPLLQLGNMAGAQDRLVEPDRLGHDDADPPGGQASLPGAAGVTGRHERVLEEDVLAEVAIAISRDISSNEKPWCLSISEFGVATMTMPPGRVMRRSSDMARSSLPYSLMCSRTSLVSVTSNRPVA